MGIIAKQSSWNFIVLYIGVILGTVNNVVMPNALSPEELGVLRIFLSMMLLGSQLALFGASHTIIRFFPKYGKGQKSGLGFWMLRNVTISTGIAVLLYILLKPMLIEAYSDSSLFGDNYYFYIPLLTFFVFQEFFGAYVRSHLKSVFQLTIKEVVLRVYQGVLFILVMGGQIQFDIFMILYVIGYLVVLIPFLVFILKHDLGNMLPSKNLPKSAKREMFRFSATIFPTGISGTVLGNIDTVMIGAMAPMLLGYDGVKLAGIYGTMLFMSMLILIPLRSIQNIAVPIISKAWKENDIEELQTIYKKSSLNMMIVGTITFIGLWINIDFVLTFFKPHFVLGKYTFLLLALGNLLHASMGVNGPIIMNGPKYWVTGIGTPLLAGLVIVTNLYFIPNYGMEGAAFATVLSKFLFNVIAYLVLLVNYKMQPFSWRSFYVVGLTLSILCISYYVPRVENQLADFFIRSILALGIFIPGILIPKISPDLNNQYSKVLTTLKIKKNN